MTENKRGQAMDSEKCCYALPCCCGLVVIILLGELITK